MEKNVGSFALQGKHTKLPVLILCLKYPAFKVSNCVTSFIDDPVVNSKFCRVKEILFVITHPSGLKKTIFLTIYCACFFCVFPAIFLQLQKRANHFFVHSFVPPGVSECKYFFFVTFSANPQKEVLSAFFESSMLY